MPRDDSRDSHEDDSEEESTDPEKAIAGGVLIWAYKKIVEE